MRAAEEILDRNREGQMSGKAYNADVTPVLDLVRNVVEQCAVLVETHTAQHEDNQPLASRIGKNMAAAIRVLVK